MRHCEQQEVSVVSLLLRFCCAHELAVARHGAPHANYVGGNTRQFAMQVRPFACLQSLVVAVSLLLYVFDYLRCVFRVVMM